MTTDTPQAAAAASLRNSQAGLASATARLGWVPPEPEWGVRFPNGHVMVCRSLSDARDRITYVSKYGGGVYELVSRSNGGPWS